MSINKLSKSSIPISYKLEITPAQSGNQLFGVSRLVMRKIRPSKRISLHLGANLKVESVRVSIENKGQTKELNFYRQYHHKKLEEIRFYSEDIIYPGQVSIELKYSGQLSTANDCLEKLKGLNDGFQLNEGQPPYARYIMPSIDEPAPLAQFELSIK